MVSDTCLIQYIHGWLPFVQQAGDSLKPAQSPVESIETFVSKTFYCEPPTLKKIHLLILSRYLKIHDKLTACQMDLFNTKLDVLKFPKLYNKWGTLIKLLPFQTWSSLVKLRKNDDGQEEIVLITNKKVILPEELHKHALWKAHGNTKAVHFRLNETLRRVSKDGINFVYLV